MPAYKEGVFASAAMNRNMVIPQPHREIANIDSAVRRNEPSTNGEIRLAVSVAALEVLRLSERS
jgi:hypothetical protein